MKRPPQRRSLKKASVPWFKLEAYQSAAHMTLADWYLQIDLRYALKQDLHWGLPQNIQIFDHYFAQVLENRPIYTRHEGVHVHDLRPSYLLSDDESFRYDPLYVRSLTVDDLGHLAQKHHELITRLARKGMANSVIQKSFSQEIEPNSTRHFLSIDVDQPDSILIEHLELFLKNLRKPVRIPRHAIDTVKWIQWGLLPLLDVLLWQKRYEADLYKAELSRLVIEPSNPNINDLDDATARVFEVAEDIFDDNSSVRERLFQQMTRELLG